MESRPGDVARVTTALDAAVALVEQPSELHCSISVPSMRMNGLCWGRAMAYAMLWVQETYLCAQQGERTEDRLSVHPGGPQLRRWRGAPKLLLINKEYNHTVRKVFCDIGAGLGNRGREQEGAVDSS